MPDDITSVLISVRKAYRLLNAYHYRILPSIRLMGETLGKQFQNWYGQPEWRGRPSNPGVFDSYLGLMPLHHGCFVFAPEETSPQPGEWMLEINHRGDSGFDKNDIANYDPAALEPAEQTRTEIHLYAAIVVSGAGSTWPVLWSGCYYPEDDPDATREIAGTKVWEGTADGCAVRVFKKVLSVMDIADEVSLKLSCTEFQRLVDRVIVET